MAATKVIPVSYSVLMELDSFIAAHPYINRAAFVAHALPELDPATDKVSIKCKENYTVNAVRRDAYIINAIRDYS